MKEHLRWLGKQVTDSVTGFTGTVSSICFDLYGCVQAIVSPRMDKSGTIADSRWFDVKRLKDNGIRVMEPPNFDIPRGQEIGSAERPKEMPRGL